MQLESWSPAPTSSGPGGRAGHQRRVVLDVRTALTRQIRLGAAVAVRGTRSGTLRLVGLVGVDSPGSGIAQVLGPITSGLLDVRAEVAR